MEAKKKLDTGRLWSTFQFIILGAALLIPLISKFYNNKKVELSHAIVNPDTPRSSVLGELETKSKSTSSAQGLSSGVLALPDISLGESIELRTKNRQIRFERKGASLGRSLASESKAAVPLYRLVKIRKRQPSGEFEEIPLINNAIGKKQAIGSIYIELENTENLFWADYMDAKGKIISQQIKIRKHP